MPATDRPYVTVAICTWNRCELLRQTLDGMLQLLPPDSEWELLVVDNNSPDATRDVARSFADRLPLRYIHEPTQGKSYALNRALADARGEYILFTDDDVLVFPGWLRAFVDTSRRRPEAGGIVGPVDPWFPSAPDPRLAAVFPELRRGFASLDLERPESDLPDEDVALIYGVNMGFKAAAVASIRFDTAFGPIPESGGRSGEDGEFLRALRRTGAAIVWSPDMRLRHYVDPRRMTLDYLLAFSRGRGRMLRRFQHGPLRSLFGVPTYLLRALAEQYAAYLRSRVALDALATLVARREIARLAGMIEESRLMAREQHVAGRGAAVPSHPTRATP